MFWKVRAMPARATRSGVRRAFAQRTRLAAQPIAKPSSAGTTPHETPVARMPSKKLANALPHENGWPNVKFAWIDVSHSALMLSATTRLADTTSPVRTARTIVPASRSRRISFARKRTRPAVGW
jgi:hypothetical protein